MMGHGYGASIVAAFVVQWGCACGRAVMVTWLHGI